MTNPLYEEAMKPIQEAPPHVKKLIAEVLKLEREWLYMQRPRVHDDVIRLVKKATPATGDER